MDNIIVVRNVKKNYDNGLVTALKGISLEIYSGEIVAIMGPSGCGKSTLLNLIGALDQPTSGEIFINSRPLSSYLPLHHFRALNIGFVFQFHHLVPYLTLQENIELPMYAISVKHSERKKRAENILHAMGLSKRKNFLPTKVSGGERQRAAIGRAIANNPNILLADEPTGNLDSETGQEIMRFLAEICRSQGMTMIVATHNNTIGDSADRIINMKDGLIA
jgi:ABC-type lipoprotein export system ATPase subunit